MKEGKPGHVSPLSSRCCAKTMLGMVLKIRFFEKGWV